MIAVCRLHHCPRTQAYAARRTAEGLSKRDIIRCLKRYIARELYHTLHADLTSLAAPTPPPRALTITCGADRPASREDAVDIYRNVCDMTGIQDLARQ